MTGITTLSRRNFIIGTGVTGLSIGVLASCGSPDAPAADLPPNPEVNAWVHIAPDETVTVRIARSEMGQGTLTGLSQLVAEELDCDWKMVTTEYPTPGESLARERVWGSYSTGGSQGIRGSHQYVREGGAAARLMLIEAAANEWGVPVSECSTEAGTITHTPSGKTVTYGKVAAAAAELAPPLEVSLKDPSEWKVAGQSYDGPAAEDGRIEFAIRPEDIAPAESGLPAKVRLVEPLGAHLLVTCDVEGTMFRAVLESDLELKTGDMLNLAPQPDRIRWFDTHSSLAVL